RPANKPKKIFDESDLSIVLLQFVVLSIYRYKVVYVTKGAKRPRIIHTAITIRSIYLQKCYIAQIRTFTEKQRSQQDLSLTSCFI
ncbi:hypothetical protein, partial [Salmonella sp. ZJJH19_0069]|uniref:hypothetical protein n=1 Tax=Salmonella sp. ZJJH19_0069 TaxID=3159617 RepID=UPI0039816A88